MPLMVEANGTLTDGSTVILPLTINAAKPEPISVMFPAIVKLTLTT